MSKQIDKIQHYPSEIRMIIWVNCPTLHSTLDLYSRDVKIYKQNCLSVFFIVYLTMFWYKRTTVVVFVSNVAEKQFCSRLRKCFSALCCAPAWWCCTCEDVWVGRAIWVWQVWKRKSHINTVYARDCESHMQKYWIDNFCCFFSFDTAIENSKIEGTSTRS